LLSAATHGAFLQELPCRSWALPIGVVQAAARAKHQRDFAHGGTNSGAFFGPAIRLAFATIGHRQATVIAFLARILAAR
jgi:hypothetical protein